MLDKQKEDFIRKAIGGYKTAVRLTGDASSRIYYRICATRETNYILCEDSGIKTQQLSDYPYKIVYDLFMDYGIPVPKVYAWDNQGLLLIQDLGDDLLESVCGVVSIDEQKNLYEKVIDILVRVQGIEKKSNGVPFSLSFDLSKLMYEFDYFIEHALCGYFGTGMREQVIKELRDEFVRISEILYKPNLFVLNHRDYISRNIMIHEGKVFLIDFQDARLGLPQYDAVSLLRDSSPRFSDDLFLYLKNYYFVSASEGGVFGMNRDEFDYYFDIMAFQRNVKALGTFGYQAYRMKKQKYVKYIEPTCSYLSDYAYRRKELEKAYRIISDHIGDRP
jgi:aminoglycoside/choline kinase family phosphotransferase